MGLYGATHAKPMHGACYREPESWIIVRIKALEVCYMMLIIGQNTLVRTILRDIIVINSVAVRFKDFWQ